MRDLVAPLPCSVHRPLTMLRTLLLFWPVILVAAPSSSFLRARHLADYNSEPRGADGRVDTDALVQRLDELGVSTYYWLVWHASTDWDDLKLFLPKAARARLQVWAYLVPPTEGRKGGYHDSQPFGEDYLRWAEELARLSLQQPNLVAWVIDDFYANHQFLTPAYVREMQSRAKQINPSFAFLPLMYFPEITHQFVSDFHEVIDGVVVAYPGDREEILNARLILNGQNLVASGLLGCPWNTPTRAGDFISATVRAKVLPRENSRLRFSEQDDFSGPTAGYHFKQVLLNGGVIWEQDVAGGAKDWQSVDLDVTPNVVGKREVTLTFRLLDKKGVSNFGVRWRIKNLQLEGLHAVATLSQPEKWQINHSGPFEAGFGPAVTNKEQPRFNIPFIVMTAADAGEFRLRHGNPASAERITEWLRMSLQTWRDGQCDGVATYCLDKRPGSPVFPLARELFQQARKPSRKVGYLNR